MVRKWKWYLLTGFSPSDSDALSGTACNQTVGARAWNSEPQPLDRSMQQELAPILSRF